MVTVKVGSVCRPKMGETVSGDAIGVWQSRGQTLAVVADGLGAGAPAAQASAQAMAAITECRDQALDEIVRRCHESMHETRGAVLGLVRIDHRASRLWFTGVGNIGFSAASAAPMHPVCQNGLVGQRLPPLLQFEFGCQPGDLIAVFTDGISPQFKRRGGLSGLSSWDWTNPQKLAEQVVDGFSLADDDAGVLILMVSVPPIGLVQRTRS